LSGVATGEDGRIGHVCPLPRGLCQSHSPSRDDAAMLGI
jgi:hypothetical protein